MTSRKSISTNIASSQKDPKTSLLHSSAILANDRSNETKTSSLVDFTQAEMILDDQGENNNKENEVMIQNDMKTNKATPRDHGANSCNKTIKNHVSDKNQNEEKENVDVAPVKQHKQLKSMQTVSLKIFGSENILADIVSNLSIVKIRKLRRVNKFFKGELTFGFECNNFNIHFYYKNVHIINIINHQCCNLLKNFIAFYLQLINLKKSRFEFTKTEAPTTPPAPLDLKVGLTSTYVVSVDVNGKIAKKKAKKKDKKEEKKEDSEEKKDEPKIVHNNNWLEFGTKLVATQHDNVSVGINPFKDIHVETKDIIEKVQEYDTSHPYAIEILLLARYYHFKPLENAIRNLILDGSNFRTFLLGKYSMDDTVDVYLDYLWQHAPTPPCQRSFLINSMLFGCFDL